MSKQSIFLIGLILGIFLLTSVSALSQQLPICWGLEGNHTGALIVCDFGPELFFIGSDIPEEALWTGSGEGADHLEVKPVIPEEVIPVSELEKQRKLFLWISIPLGCCFLFLIFGKKRCDYCKKRFKRKNLIVYQKNYYCKECLEKIETFKKD